MSRKEVKDFMERIRSYYPNKFIVDSYKINEWNEVLQYYDKNDLNSRFEQHQRNEEFKDKVPSLDFLIKYLTPITSKSNDFAYECSKCHKIFDSKKEYDAHYIRCMQISTMVRDMNKYFKKELTRENFSKYSDEEIQKFYYIYVDRMLKLEYGLSGERRKILLNCLPSEVKAKYDTNEVVGGEYQEEECKIKA